MRADGRQLNQSREVVVAYEGLDRVDGSARFGFGQTQCIVSVSGPIEVRATMELPHQATLDILIRPLAALPGTDSKALASTLRSIFTPTLLLSHHPRTLIQIVGQALSGSETGSGAGSAGREWHPSLIASLVNATTAAFLNAGSIPMKGVACAVAVGRVSGSSAKAKSTLVLDPSEAELSTLSASGCFVFLFSSTLKSPSQEVIPPCSLLLTNYSSHGASFSVTELEEARDLAEEGVAEIWKVLKASIGARSGELFTTPASKGVVAQNTDPGSEDDEKMEI